MPTVKGWESQTTRGHGQLTTLEAGHPGGSRVPGLQAHKNCPILTFIYVQGIQGNITADHPHKVMGLISRDQRGTNSFFFFFFFNGSRCSLQTDVIYEYIFFMYPVHNDSFLSNA